MKITVVKHKAGTTTKLPGACYVGRTNSVREQYLLSTPCLANPFRVGRDGDRNEVIRKFRQWLWGQIQRPGQVLRELEDVWRWANLPHGVVLVCHCAPLACHGDVIKAAAEWLNGVIDPVVAMAVEELDARVLSTKGVSTMTK